MNKNSRTWKIFESVNPRESSQCFNGVNEFLEQVPVDSFEAISNANDEANNFTIPSPQPSCSYLLTLENVSLIELNEDLHLSDSSEDYVPTPDECLLSSTDCSVLLSTSETIRDSVQENNKNVSGISVWSERILNFENRNSVEDYVPTPDECILSSTDCSVLLSTSGTIRDNVQEKDRNISGVSDLSESILNLENRESLDENLEVNTTDTAGVESVIPGHQNRKRKRRGQADPSKWKKNLRKNKRQKGEPYLSSKGVLRPGKTLGESKCMGMCREKCTNKFNPEERLEIFTSFWDIDSVDQKRQYIVALVNRVPTQTRRTANLESKRKMTNKYFLKKKAATEKEKVCQKFFLATLNVSETFVRFCFKKMTETNVVEADMRGKHIPHNKKPEDIKQFIRDHINSFPRMPAHYVRKDTKKEYLDQDLNVTKMYELYKSKCDDAQREPVDISYYRMILNKEFNIGFYRPRKDVCDKCFTFQHLNEEEKENQKEQYEEHLGNKVIARRHRDEDKLSAQSGDIHFVEYDLEAICNCPSSSSKLIYYKRRIAIYNFTMLDFDKEMRNVYCYCWHEGIGRKGAIEIGSCLIKYLKSKADGKPITFMSDTCASQCRNMYISSLLLYCVEVFNIPEINQKYFEPGHSEMEADNIHATIEQAKKNIPIFHPSGFYTIIRKASRKCPYDVYEMGTEDFIDIKDLKTILIKNAKVDCDGNAVNWLKIKWLQYRKKDTKHIYFKYNLDDTEFKMIKIIRRGKRLTVGKIVLKAAYEGQLPISAEKYEDLQDLCRQGIIPSQYHNFYKSFSVGTINVEEDNY